MPPTETEHEQAATLRRHGFRLEAEWHLIRASLPPDIPELQQMLFRDAYYAGAAMVFETLVYGMDEGADLTDAGHKRLSDLQEELAAWQEDCGRRIEAHERKAAERKKASQDAPQSTEHPPG